MTFIEENGYVFIKNQKFKLLKKVGISKYSTDSYIGKIFGSDLCIYYLGKNDKGQPFIIVECQLCGILREVNAYNIGLRTMKKCDCVSQRPSLSKKRENYLQYVNKEIYGLKIKDLKQVGRHFYFQGFCKHNNFIEVEVSKFLEKREYNCKCNTKPYKEFSEEYIIRQNKRWFEKFSHYVGKVVDNKVIIGLKEKIEDIDIKKKDAYRSLRFKTKCLSCDREIEIVAYIAYLMLYNPENIEKLELKRCICQRSKYLDENFIGQIFGRLRVEGIEYNEKTGEVVWNCECTCKKRTKIKAVAGAVYVGSRKSCGCLRRESIQNNSPYIDERYIGQIYGRVNEKGGLKVLSIDTDSNISGIQWDCECLFCHDIVKLPAGQVVKGSLQSCGCHHTENTTFYKDRKFIGQKFNGIEVLDILDNRGAGYYWKCKCPYCGKEFEELGSKIANKLKVSCGCQQGSFYEQYIAYLLDRAGLLYRREVSFKGLVSKKKRPLRYDFALYDERTDEILYLIEYDGQQHFDVNAQIGAKSYEEAVEMFKDLQERDRIKNNFAQNNNIPLKRFNKDNIKDIDSFLLYLVDIKRKNI